MRRLPLLILTFVVVGGCRQPASEPAPVAKAHPNVLLVTIDTLRADHLGSYGAANAMTPTLDALAKRGVRFETALSHVPLTGPSHASILTGRTPPGHGFRNNGGYVLAPTLRTAAEDFKQGGYRTAAFVSAFPLDRRFGFDRGFDVYEDHLPRGNDPRRTPYVERRADATTDAALALAGRSEPGRRQQSAGSCGSTTTIRTRRTSRRPISPSASATPPTTARSRSSIASCRASSR